jgi:hypothetical protein
MSSAFRPLAALAIVALAGAGCSSGSAGNGTTASPSGTGPKNAAREKAVKFSKCVREHGVAAFPDPDASGELTIDAIANGSSLDTSTAAFKNAISACKDLQPPGFTGGKRSDQAQEHALEFAQCIRENGVKDFPDPINGQPLVDTNRIPSSAADGGMARLNAAMQTCRELAAKAGAGHR